jgi:hypothetical protein
VVTLLFRVREVPGSNLGPEAGNLNRGVSLFFAVPSEKK